MIASELRKFWQASAALTFTALFMFVLFAACLVGLQIDTRAIAGAPAWLKPAKFAISITIYCATMAWIYRYLTSSPRLVRVSGWIFTLVFFMEQVIIVVQAWRGKISHFNAATALDAGLFTAMGISIAILWITSGFVTVAAFRQPFMNRGLGLAIRLGLAISFLGAGSGWVMTVPTESQREMIRADRNPGAAGAHTVGAPDGGPGMPLTAWSLDHGDLRIPHFLGLHAMQMIPLLYWFVYMRRRNGDGERFVWTLAASYVLLTLVFFWQAERGQSLIHPDSLTLVVMAIWLLLTVPMNGAALRT